MTCRKGLLRCEKTGAFRTQGRAARPDGISPAHTAKPWKTGIRTGSPPHSCHAKAAGRKGGRIFVEIAAMRKHAACPQLALPPFFVVAGLLDAPATVLLGAMTARKLQDIRSRAVMVHEISRMCIPGCHHIVFPLECNARCRPAGLIPRGRDARRAGEPLLLQAEGRARNKEPAEPAVVKTQCLTST